MKILTSKKSGFLSAFTLLLVFAFGCANKETQFDTPEKVATVFWSAIKAGDVETAKAQVYEARRASLGKMIARDITEGIVPTLPDELSFKLEENGETVLVIVENSNGVACEMIKFEGRWWVL